MQWILGRQTLLLVKCSSRYRAQSGILFRQTLSNSRNQPGIWQASEWTATYMGPGHVSFAWLALLHCNHCDDHADIETCISMRTFVPELWLTFEPGRKAVKTGYSKRRLPITDCQQIAGWNRSAAGCHLWQARLIVGGERVCLSTYQHCFSVPRLLCRCFDRAHPCTDLCHTHVPSMWMGITSCYRRTRQQNLSRPDESSRTIAETLKRPIRSRRPSKCWVPIHC